MPIGFLSALAALAFLFIPFWPVQWAAVFWLAVVVLSWMYREIIRLNLHIRRRERRFATFRHQDAIIRIDVRNASFLPVPMLSIVDATGTLYDADAAAFILALRPWARRTLSYPVRGHVRGRYPLGPLRVRTADPLGLFPIDTRVNAYAHVLVYPRILEIAVPRRGGFAGGTVRAPRTLQEDTSRFRSLRDYSPGDETRRISWKASAHLGSLKTVEYLRTVTVPALVLLNLAQEDYQERRRHRAVERAIEIAASLAAAAAEAGQPVGMITNGRLEGGPAPVLPVRPGYAHTVALLEVLAEVAMRPKEANATTGALVRAAGDGAAAGGAPSGTTDGAWRELMDPLAGMRRGYGMRLLYVGPPLRDAELRELAAIWGAGAPADLFYVHGLEREPEREAERPAVSGYAVHDVQLFGGVQRSGVQRSSGAAGGAAGAAGPGGESRPGGGGTP
ncbi:MAG: DUF58 domain-containing protein [bacterium]